MTSIFEIAFIEKVQVENLYSIEEAKQNRGFDIYGKKSGLLLKEWYTTKS